MSQPELSRWSWCRASGQANLKKINNKVGFLCVSGCKNQKQPAVLLWALLGDRISNRSAGGNLHSKQFYSKWLYLKYCHYKPLVNGSSEKAIKIFKTTISRFLLLVSLDLSAFRIWVFSGKSHGQQSTEAELWGNHLTTGAGTLRKHWILRDSH